MDKEFVRIEVNWTSNIENKLESRCENIKNYTYFQPTSPFRTIRRQHPSTFGHIIPRLQQLEFFIWTMKLPAAKSSNSAILPLPDLSLYYNLYIDFKLAKKYWVFNWVLMHVTLPNTMHRLICLLRDNSTYQPTNDQVEIGGYPIVNVYANLHLKRYVSSLWCIT